jgi:aminoglycoside phosphotransferase (APT) family kinase protein
MRVDGLDARLPAAGLRAARRDVLAAAALVDDDLAGARSPARGHRPALVHGDWHLGQVGRLGGPARGWRLLDVDDLGLGDPAWDLARPAGLWAAGLLDDRAWFTFLDAYREAAGPGVPAEGDPWPSLDAVARAAVVQAAAAGLVAAAERRGPLDEVDEALVSACHRITGRTATERPAAEPPAQVGRHVGCSSNRDEGSPP